MHQRLLDKQIEGVGVNGAKHVVPGVGGWVLGKAVDGEMLV